MTTTTLNGDPIGDEEKDDEEELFLDLNNPEVNTVLEDLSGTYGNELKNVAEEEDKQTEDKQTQIKTKYKNIRETLHSKGRHPSPEVDLRTPWSEETNAFKGRPWYEQLGAWFFTPDYDPRQTADWVNTIEKFELGIAERYPDSEMNVKEWSSEIVKSLTNHYTTRLTRGINHEIERLDTPSEFLTRVPYIGLRTVLPKAQANFAYLGTLDAVTGAFTNIADWDWNYLENIPGNQGLKLLPKEWKQGSYIDKGFGFLDEFQRSYYKNNGFKDPALWTEEELAGAEMRSSTVLNGFLALVTMGAGNLVAGSTTINANLPWLAKSARWLNASNAKGFWDILARTSVANALDTVPSTWLDRNESGSAASFLQLIGIDWDPATEPGLTKWESAQAAFIPNLTAAVLFSSLLNIAPLSKSLKDAKGFEKLDLNIEGSLAKGKDFLERSGLEETAVGLLERAENINNQIRSWIEGNFSQTYRSLRSRDKFYRRTDIRAKQVGDGIIAENSDGSYRQGDLFSKTDLNTDKGQVKTELTKDQQTATAEASLIKKHFPEEAIESDALAEAITTGSNSQILEIETRTKNGEGIIQVTNEVLERPPVEKEFPSTEKFNLVKQNTEEGFEFELDFINDLEKEQLDELLKDKKILARIKTLTGKSDEDPWVTIDRIDIAKALKDLQANDGLVIQKIPDVYEEAMGNVKRIQESLNVEKIEGEVPIQRIDTRGFEKDDMLAYNRLVKAIDNAIGSEWKGGIDTAGDVLNVLNVARVTVEEGVQKALRDFARVTTSLSGRRLNVTEQIPGARFVLNQARRDRRELINGITKRALERGEARPPSTTLPKTPEPGNFNSEKVVDDLLNAKFTPEVLEALDNEVRLIDENGKLDAAIKADKKIAERRFTDYESKTYEQKKADGEILPKTRRTQEEIIDQQNRMDASPAAKRGRKKIEPGTPHPDDPKKVRGYDGRWVTRQYFNQQTAARKAAEGGSGFQQSNIGPDVDFTGGRYNEQKVREALMKVKRGQDAKKVALLNEYGPQIAETLQGRINQSIELANELKEALIDTYRTSGIPRERIKIVDEIDTIQLFGLDETIASTADWRPQAATFMARNPDDPLTKVAAGETTGLYSPGEIGQLHKSMIYFALHPNLSYRLGGLQGRGKAFPRWFGIDFAHESFHGIQKWLDQLHNTRYLAAISKFEALEEMVGIIKKGKGNYQKNMAPSEIQAESFGIWFTNKKIKLKSGPVKASFERLKTFLSTLRRKINLILRKDPSYIDVFELAASGKIARKGLIKELTPQQIEGLVPRINASIDAEMPELTMRIWEFLEAKKFEYDDLLGSNNSKFNKGGCT